MPSVFVGRVEELDALLQSMDAATAGHPRCVLVEGAHGSGKTALLLAFRGLLSDGSSVMATGDEAETELPYGLVDELRRQLGPDAVNQIDRAERHDSPFVVGAAFLQLIGRSSQLHPLVLILDDVNLADLPSLAALTYAARRLSVEHVLLVLAARHLGSRNIPPGLERLVQDRGTRLMLRGLSIDEVRQLARAESFGQLSLGAAARLRDHTCGNPLRLRAVMSELTVEQAEMLDAPLPVPDWLAQRVHGMVAALSPPAQQLAAASAVLGLQVSVRVAGVVAAVGDPRAAADELCGARLMQRVETPYGSFLRFTDPLLRAAVYHHLGLADRGRLHARASGLCRGAEALQHRVSAALGPNPALVAALVRQARRDESQGCTESAAGALVSASRLSADGPAEAQLLVAAIDLLLLAGDVKTASLHASALERTSPGAMSPAVRARMAWLTGRVDQAQLRSHLAWEHSASLNPVVRHHLAGTMTQIARAQDGLAESSATWALRALAAGLPPSELAVTTRAAGGNVLRSSGRAPEGMAPLTSLPADPADVPTCDHQLLGLLGLRGVLRLMADDLAGAQADLERVIFATARGVRPHQLAALGALAEVAYRSGDWDRSVSLAQHLVDLVEVTGQAWLLAYGHAQSVLTLAGRGQWGLAESHLQAAEQAQDPLRDRVSWACATNASIHLAYCRGDLEGVVVKSRVLLADRSCSIGDPGGGWQPQYVSALVGLARLDEAEAALTHLERLLPRARQTRSRQAVLARVRGELEASRRRTQNARTALLEAFRLGTGAGDALETALTRMALGRFLRRRGELRHAVVHLQQAQQSFTRLGAAPFLTRCEAELAACGRTVHRAPSSALPATLTRQELAVAQLVAVGRQNQEIADELVLSVKTVTYHLGHVFAKLGVRSRTELAARWRLLGAQEASAPIAEPSSGATGLVAHA